MSMIPSSRGSSAGMSTLVQGYDNTSALMMIASLGTVPDSSTTAPISVREFDEIVLNVRIKDNFGDVATFGGGFGGYTFAQVLNIKVLYSNMVDFVQLPPILGTTPTTTTHWSPLLLEDVATPFTGSVEIAEYDITIKGINIGCSGNYPDGTTWGPASSSHVERLINLRIPTTMAEWVAFSVSADTNGAGGPLAADTSPIIEFHAYRGLAL